MLEEALETAAAKAVATTSEAVVDFSATPKATATAATEAMSRKRFKCLAENCSCTFISAKTLDTHYGIYHKNAKLLCEICGHLIADIARHRLACDLPAKRVKLGTSYIELPPSPKGSHTILNICNKDYECFLWSILAHLYPAANKRNRASQYKMYKPTLNLKGVDFPMTLGGINHFELLNKLRVNVFGYDEKENNIVILRRTKLEPDFGQLINLLLIQDQEKQHYCLITSFNGLMKGRRTRHTGTEYYCMNCLHGFNKKETLEKHELYCTKPGLKDHSKNAIRYMNLATQA